LAAANTTTAWNGLAVAAVTPVSSAASGGPTADFAVLSKSSTVGNGTDAAWLSGGAIVNAPTEPGTSPVGPPSSAPSSGSGPLPGGQTSDVESQLARTWSERLRDIYEKYVKPYVDTAIGAVTPTGIGEAKDTLEMTPEISRILINRRQENKTLDSGARDLDLNGEYFKNLDELERRKRINNPSFEQ
jgi:hypothetical protein